MSRVHTLGVPPTLGLHASGVQMLRVQASRVQVPGLVGAEGEVRPMLHFMLGRLANKFAVILLFPGEGADAYHLLSQAACSLSPCSSKAAGWSH